MPLPSEDIERIKYADTHEDVHDYERDRINERLTIWSLFLTMTTIFGYIGAQSNDQALIVGLFPLLVSCLAQHIDASEITLKEKRDELYHQEEAVGITASGQHYYQEKKTSAPEKHKKLASGGNKKALRKAFFTTSLLATYLFETHLQHNHVNSILLIGIIGIELFFTLQTAYWLTYRKPIYRWWKKKLNTRKKPIETKSKTI